MLKLKIGLYGINKSVIVLEFHILYTIFRDDISSNLDGEVKVPVSIQNR